MGLSDDNQHSLEEEVTVKLKPLTRKELSLDIIFHVEDASVVKDTPQFRYDKPLSFKDLSDLITFSFGVYQKTDVKGRSIKKAREMIPKVLNHDFERDFYEILLLGEIDYQDQKIEGIFRYDRINNQLTKIREFTKDLQTSLGGKFFSKAIRRGKCLLLIYNPNRPKRIFAYAPTRYPTGLEQSNGHIKKLISEINRLNKRLHQEDI